MTYLDRRGVALALAVYALVVVLALVAAVFMVATTEQRSAETTRGIYQALALAEAGASEAIGAWNPRSFHMLRDYPRDSMLLEPRRSPMGTGDFRGTIRKLNAGLFLIDIAATSAGALGGVESRVGVVARIPPPSATLSALTVRDLDRLPGSIAVDSSPDRPRTPAWQDCDTDPDSAGGGGIRVGAPDGADEFGAGAYEGWASQAAVVLPGARYQTHPSMLGDGRCDTTDPLNWGDPSRTTDCAEYYPVIHVRGDAILTAGKGQGILLVDGNLRIGGSYQFFGLVLVQGVLAATPGTDADASIWGTVRAARVAEDAPASGTLQITASNCAVHMALRASTPPRPLRSRAWSQLF